MTELQKITGFPPIVQTLNSQIQAQPLVIPKPIPDKFEKHDNTSLVLGASATVGGLGVGLSAEKIVQKSVSSKITNSLNKLLSPYVDFLSGKSEKLELEKICAPVFDSIDENFGLLPDEETASDLDTIYSRLKSRSGLVNKMNADKDELPELVNIIQSNIKEQLDKMPEVNESMSAKIATQVEAITEFLNPETFEADKALKKLATIIGDSTKVIGSKLSEFVHISTKAKIGAGLLGALATAGLASIGLVAAKKISNDK